MSTQPPSTTPANAALLQACRNVLAPLAELAIARGVHYDELDEVLRCAFVDAALAAHPEVAPQRAVSRVSTATGLNRREVSRLIQREPVAQSKRSPATQVFTRWLSDPLWRAHGRALSSLPRTGPASFETLAQSVTKDVHPRSLLEELCRLGLARVDTAADRVELVRERFAPAGDETRMLAFVSSNVGDHLRACVANVLADEPPHLEQALFADELSAESLERLQPIVRAQWQQVLRSLAPKVQKMIEDDQARQRVQDQRLRVGLYAYTEPMHSAAPAMAETKPAAAKKAAPARRRSP
ncbi:MAG: hypothetical protein H7Y33_12065 [Cytophagales bacterium]|nr:hypothetical protein [Rhizobacter sp.]